MTPESMIAFNLVLLAALASPGAAMLYVIKTTVSAGHMSGVFAGAGLGLAAACWTAAAFMGLQTLFQFFPWAYTALRLGGALYLIWIAFQTWRGATTPLSNTAPPHARSFIAGMLVNFGNPKSMLFAAAVILVVFPQGLSTSQITMVVLNHFILELVFYAAFATLLSAGPAKRGYLALKPVFDRIAATLLGALGVRLLLER